MEPSWMRRWRRAVDAVKLDTNARISDEDDSMVDEDITVQDVYDSLTAEQKHCLHLIIGVAIECGRHSARRTAARTGRYDTFSPQQKRVTWYLVDEAFKQARG